MCFFHNSVVKNIEDLNIGIGALNFGMILENELLALKLLIKKPPSWTQRRSVKKRGTERSSREDTGDS